MIFFLVDLTPDCLLWLLCSGHSWKSGGHKASGLLQGGFCCVEGVVVLTCRRGCACRCIVCRNLTTMSSNNLITIINPVNLIFTTPR